LVLFHNRHNSLHHHFLIISDLISGIHYSIYQLIPPVWHLGIHQGLHLTPDTVVHMCKVW
jgi:hypothetical protein